ncbi:HAD family hydrolase [Pseudonocardia abyssalis]|jgi:putative hydrolase of the HAD superfamily|uniref:HAD-IA family hydrolase n=1 Tax=Pseudonocardia abyssalis TaxID=2792008 RepID=A0ABS6UM67_9PSEU|nr:HAD-IA family hydrolase [Pseudonocardia abyssalis]MBW0115175.1 HAD-IA family hydrolase [Pseudonocardia abyssalis]MBW0133003.1 HAD-IA family hydrolase [Pseudonocardia abyssalis]
MRALLLDLGGTVFRSGNEMLALLGEAEPATAAVVARRGPLGTEPDPSWDAMIRREITEREYWALRSDEVGAALGREWPIQEFMHTLYALVGDDIIRPAAAELIADARAAGHRIGVLTNDLRAFHGETAMASHPVLAQVDALVDASVTGILKPDPRAYALAAAELGTAPGDIVFVDDMPWNVTGARAAGMIAVELDLTDPDAAFAVARRELNLDAEAA